MGDLIKQYLAKEEAEYERGNATEHSYRPALKRLIELFGAVHAVIPQWPVQVGET